MKRRSQGSTQARIEKGYVEAGIKDGCVVLTQGNTLATVAVYLTETDAEELIKVLKRGILLLKGSEKIGQN